MAAIVNDETGVERSVEGFSNGQRYHAGEALAEWRSSEQLENGTPSTSPPYWDTDDDDDSGPKPSELYGKYTWRIEKFSQINKRELRSNAFEVGGYKWYILIYPQGCDVSNHLSLFLCVANHEKLLPGWSHFAQFTIAVVNKDPKKSKYSDTLHRFWKKEHDWGWKKFMELSKVSDGFLEADTLIIKAQVQVIRESAHRPFRCLDCEYRRELVRVYLTNVEQVCRRFVEERRGKLSRLIEDKSRWSSFCAFWLGIDQNMRRRMSREKSDVILKVAVKHFFIEKEVTSTLVMDSLYSGLKALEGQCKGNKRKSKFLDHDEIPAPIICMEKDMFVLVDDVLLLLERAALEPLPPKDEKAPQNRTKDGNSGEDFNRDSIERDERRLTELGRRTVEIFVLAHIFSNKIEVAYQEAVALRRQEELIREEEAAWLAEVEQKAKRGASEKEKKSKKKQAKQKRNSRKGKDKARDEKSSAAAQVISEQNSCADEKEASNTEETQLDAEIFNTQDVSDISDVMDGVGETLLPGSEDRDPSPVNWDTDASEVHPPIEGSSSEVTGLSCIQNGGADKTNTCMVDDSSSTCSTDSVPSVVMSGPYRGSTFSNHQGRKSRGRGKNHRDKVASDVSSCTTEADCEASGPVADAVEFSNVSGSGKAVDSERDPEPEAVVSPSQDQIKCLDQKTATEEAPLKMCAKYSSDSDRTKEVMSAVQSSHSTPKNASPAVQFRSEQKSRDPANPVPVRKRYPSGSQPDQEMSSSASSQVRGTLNSEPETIDAYKDYKPGEKHVSPLVPVTSRSSSTNTPPVPASRSNAPVVSPIPTATMPARSAGAVGRLGPDPTPATHSHVPQSYRNAILGNHVVSSSGVSNHNSSSSGVSQSPAFAQPPSMASTPVFLPQNSERLNASCVQSSFPFARLSPDELHNGEQQMESSPRDVSRSLHGSLLLSGIQNFDLSKQFNLGSREQFSSEFRPCTSGRQSQGVLADEFPHLDIINDLLNEEHGIGRAARARMGLQSVSNGSQSLNRQFSFPPNISMPGEPGSSSSSCRFERTRSFQDGRFQRGYSSSNEHFNSLPEYVPQANQQSYANGHMDGLIPIQWQMASSDIMAIRSTEGENFPYHSPEYSNVECGMNGYAVYQPSKGL